MSSSRSRIAALNDIRDQPAYPLAEAARYLKLAPATLRSWVLGRRYPTANGVVKFPPLMQPARRRPPTLSFWNLIEAHVLHAMRTDHGVSVKALRKALAYAEKELRIERLLLSPELRSAAGELFLDQYGKLISLSASGQLAMRHILAEYLKRVEWDDSDFPIRLYPFLAAGNLTTERPIAIDPSIAFGRPVVLSRGVSTAAIAGRIDAGESVADLAADYDLTADEIQQAVVYERAA